MKMKVFPAHAFETGPNIFFSTHFRACEIPQPITCSVFFISPEQFCMYFDYLNQDLTVNWSASALNSHSAIYLKLFCLFAWPICSATLPWRDY